MATPHDTTLAPNSSSQNTDFELVNISPSTTPDIEGSTKSNSTPFIAMTKIERNSNSNSGAASGVENIKEEEIEPLTEPSPSPAHHGCSASPSPVPIIPKNRRRPGSSSDGNKVMMTGTVLQGSGGGTPVEVEVELSGRELERLTLSRDSQRKDKGKPCGGCGARRGPHIVALSVLSIPVAFVISLGLSFYNISITWYNLFIYLSEEKSLVHRLTLCPLLVLSFPVSVGLSTLALSVAASLIQVSWTWHRWLSEMVDGEKGFCGWLCNKLTLPDCSPYQLVILDDESTIPF